MLCSTLWEQRVNVMQHPVGVKGHCFAAPCGRKGLMFSLRGQGGLRRHV